MGAPEDIECTSLFGCIGQIALIDINTGELDIYRRHSPKCLVMEILTILYTLYICILYKTAHLKFSISHI